MQLEKIDLVLDELEALRLANVLDLCQVEAANRMGVSQSTNNRILRADREKVARAIVDGCALRIRRPEQNEAIELTASREVEQRSRRGRA